MNDSDFASEHLRVIRQLMERATVYRAISAPTALVGGLAAVALAWWHSEHGMTGKLFLRSWFSLFAVLSAVNLILLWLDSRKRGQPFNSSGMRMALRAISPPLLVGAVVGTGAVRIHGDLGFCAALWCLCYGLALLATASFAPPSINRLGRAFVLGGLICYLGNQAGFFKLRDVDVFTSYGIMGGMFGLLHILYGVAVLLTSRLGAR